MALTGTHNELGALIRAHVDSAVAAHPESNPDQREAVFVAMATAIIQHLVTHATITIAPGSVAVGVTGGAASVPVTGTAALT